MIKETLYTMKSLHRDEFRIEGFRFGSGEKTMALIGAMRGERNTATVHLLADGGALERAGKYGRTRPRQEYSDHPLVQPLLYERGKTFLVNGQHRH